MRHQFLRACFANPMRCIAWLLCAVLVYGQGSSPVTFHAYSNLLQIPVLVLNRSLKSVPHIQPSRFAVSLDAGPKFRPTHVRTQGDDPIALSILLDVGESSGDLIPGIGDAISRLSPKYLRASDRVSIYALDCALKRTLFHAPANNAQLKGSVETALQPWNNRQRQKQPGCSHPVHLWDALAIVTSDMSSLPGRRVILAVTDGEDHGSVNLWNPLRIFALASAVAVFGMSSREDWGTEDPFQLLTAQTGGIVFSTRKSKVPHELERFTTMLRERYIVEFPRTDSAASGPHSFDVTIANSNAVIRSTGISVPVADPRVLGDPMTIASDPSRAPQPGNRRILAPN